MTGDPMLIKAARVERELLESVHRDETYPAGYEVVESQLLESAALVIQQMRLRLEVSGE